MVTYVNVYTPRFYDSDLVVSELICRIPQGGYMRFITAQEQDVLEQMIR